MRRLFKYVVKNMNQQTQLKTMTSGKDLHRILDLKYLHQNLQNVIQEIQWNLGTLERYLVRGDSWNVKDKK